jgi:uncharacterized protein
MNAGMNIFQSRFNKMTKTIFISAAVLALIALLCIAYGFLIEPNRLLANSYEIKIDGWNKAFDNYKIVAISDIHGGSNFIDEAKIRKVVELANEQNADLIVLLGDYVSQQSGDRSLLKMPISTIANNLKGLKAKDGVFAVLGNHDGWYSDEKVKTEFERVGYRVLENEIVDIKRGSEKFRLFGLKDQMKIKGWYIFADEMREILNRDPNSNVVILEHSPDILPIFTNDISIAKDIKLMLCGHTHGGQVSLPIVGTPMVPSGFGQKYANGLVVEKNINLFVTPGIGTSIIPVRFGVPPEISVLTINQNTER